MFQFSRLIFDCQLYKHILQLRLAKLPRAYVKSFDARNHERRSKFKLIIIIYRRINITFQFPMWQIVRKLLTPNMLVSQFPRLVSLSSSIYFSTTSIFVLLLSFNDTSNRKIVNLKFHTWLINIFSNLFTTLPCVQNERRQLRSKTKFSAIQCSLHNFHSILESSVDSY